VGEGEPEAGEGGVPSNTMCLPKTGSDTWPAAMGPNSAAWSPATHAAESYSVTVRFSSTTVGVPPSLHAAPFKRLVRRCEREMRARQGSKRFECNHAPSVSGCGAVALCCSS
jgi:hypothetical protein